MSNKAHKSIGSSDVHVGESRSSQNARTNTGNRERQRADNQQTTNATLTRALLTAFALLTPTLAQAQTIGKPASPDLIKSMDLTVFPDGRGLPPGSGTVAKGKDLFKEKCAVCHNDHGEGREGQYPALVGGKGSINTPKPIKTVGSYWPYATTIFDYVRRAMPYDQPGTLKPDEIYSAVAFILNANGIIGDNDEINSTTLPKIKMPNRDGFVPDKRPDVKAKR